jgi:serine/threonine-protein kinase
MATVEHTSTISTAPTFVADRPQALGRIGNWQLVRLIREGNFTRVYQAAPADRADDQPQAAYALKVLRKEWWRDPQAIEMQRREVWVGVKSSHPNLLPVLSASVQQPPFYFVTPLLKSQSLTQMLESGCPPLPFALWIARQTAEALAALYDSAKLIHTDVNPSNILVSSTGHATLIDFGLCQTSDETSRWGVRSLQGTLGYIAPELLTSALSAGTFSDVYSLGATLYEMIAGQPPFASDDPAELAVLHRETKPTCLRQLRPDLPKPIASLVHSMLAKDSARRPNSASDIIPRLVRLEIDCFAMG